MEIAGSPSSSPKWEASWSPPLLVDETLMPCWLARARQFSARSARLPLASALSTLILRTSGERPVPSRFLTRNDTLSGVVNVDDPESEDRRLNGVYGVDGVLGDL